MDTTEYLIKLYDGHFQKYGVTQEGLGWGKKNRSDIRFHVLTSHFHLDGSSILDVGCGFGDLFPFLKKQKVKAFRYTGIDINPAFVDIAEKKYPEGKFFVANLLGKKLPSHFDYVFASGIFNDKIPGAKKRTEKMLDAINAHTRKGFAVNFLSDKVDYRLPHTNHTDPAWALRLCYEFSRNVILRNDYMPFEFTIIVNKDEKFDKKKSVYDSYEAIHA